MTAGTAPLRPLTRLGRTGAFASTWAEFLDWCGETIDPDADPWLLYPFGLMGASALPTIAGPVVYASINTAGRCRYVGQSLDVQARFADHGRDLGRRERWSYVVVAGLTGIDEGRLDEAERIAALICRPIEGKRHPRRR